MTMFFQNNALEFISLPYKYIMSMSNTPHLHLLQLAQLSSEYQLRPALRGWVILDYELSGDMALRNTQPFLI